MPFKVYAEIKLLLSRCLEKTNRSGLSHKICSAHTASRQLLFFSHMPYAGATRHCRLAMGPFIFTPASYGQHLALWAIRAYQRYLSPYKGFSCAYRVLTGRDSCSAYGYRVIARHGLIQGWALLQRRLHACGAHHRAHLALHPPVLRTARHRAQAGHCDVPSTDCGDCSCSLDDLVNAITLLNCDWTPGKKRPPSRNIYTTSNELKRQQVEHRQKIARMQEPES